MLQDQATLNARYQTFLKVVADTGEVWGLISDDGWASAESNQYEDTEVIVFWSDKALCAASKKEEWENYEPDNVEVGEFLESWCIGMHNESSLAGINWDVNLFGKEVEPLQLALDLTNHLIQKKKKVDLLEYESLTEFRKALEEVIRQEEADRDGQ